MHQHTTLGNGLTVATDFMPHVETVSLGIFVAAGTANEEKINNGVAHFLEHMAFKGTKTRTALDIARTIEDVGGYMNAYTSYDQTAYYLKVLHEGLPLAVELLADILQNSSFDEGEMERERGVILQEIGECADTPDDILFDHLQGTAYPEQAYGRPILGTSAGIKAMQRQQLMDFVSHNYSTGNMLIAAAGRVDHDELTKLVGEHFTQMKKSKFDPAQPPFFVGGMHLDQRQLEQAHLALAYPGLPMNHDSSVALSVWASCLGGGMASRLFQEVREKRGLAYSISCGHSTSRQSGMVYVYAGTGPEQTEELMTIVHKELHEATETLTEREISRAKIQFSAGLRRAQESTESRMGALASSWFNFGRLRSLEEVLERIDNVTLKSAMAAGKETLNQPTALAAVGPVHEEMLTAA